MYRLRAQVAIENAERRRSPCWPCSATAPSNASVWRRSRDRPDEGDALLAVDPRLRRARACASCCRAGEVDAFVAAHGLAPAPFAAYDRHRLALGVPDGSRDLVVDKSLLLESGFEELNGVSFTKGCFVGQELTARTKHRGLVKKRLLPVRVDGPLPAAGHARHPRRPGCRRDALRRRQSGAGPAAAGAAGRRHRSTARLLMARRGRSSTPRTRRRWLALPASSMACRSAR